MNIAYVITTINGPTRAVRAIHERVGDALIVVGDTKTPDHLFDNFSHYLGAGSNRWMTLRVSDHYARKNLGYLWAMSRGAEWIRETDDDNEPYDTFYDRPALWIEAPMIGGSEEWVNIFKLYLPGHGPHIWPRGLPLRYTHTVPRPSTLVRCNVGIYQGLSDGAPDVDAFQRLVKLCDDNVKFTHSFNLTAFNTSGPWTPFNSQLTTWHKDTFPLMYLPVTCRFRVTDILRGYVALALLDPDLSLVYQGALAHQDRNPHDFTQDLVNELPLYEKNWRVIIESSSFGESVGDRMFNVYSALVAEGIVASAELHYLYRWLRDWEATR
jgi:hypothetical protein